MIRRSVELATLRPAPFPDGGTDRTLEELERVIEAGIATFIEVGLALSEIRDRRLYREQGYASFDDYCRRRWGMSRYYAYRHIQAAGVAAMLPNGNKPVNEAQARELARLKEIDEIIVVWEQLRQEYGDDVTAERIRRVVARRLDRVRRERALRDRLPALPASTLPPTIDLRIGDFRQVLSEVGDGTASLVLTDLPYGGSHLDLWSDLTDLAARVLRPGGLLVTYVGQTHLPHVLSSLSRRLEYIWTLAVLGRGPKTVVHSRRVHSAWKPVVLFARPPYERRDWIEDLHHGAGPAEKLLHEWEQPEEEALYFVVRFSQPGDLILDPCMGTGVNGLAALRLGRRFVGTDLDAAAVAVARQRVGDIGPARGGDVPLARMGVT